MKYLQNVGLRVSTEETSEDLAVAKKIILKLMRETGSDGMDWIHLTQDRAWWGPL
jgi:hypothetical protein